MQGGGAVTLGQTSQNQTSKTSLHQYHPPQTMVGSTVGGVNQHGGAPQSGQL